MERSEVQNLRYKRIFTIVLDSLGIGEMPDAWQYNDEGADTLGHILEHYPDLKIPNLKKLGLLQLKKECSVLTADEMNSSEYLQAGEGKSEFLGYRGVMKEASQGKDTMTGHWEMMGLRMDTPFRTFTEHGFPDELLKELSERTGRRIIGNKSASGTEILEELGEEELATGALIVYTSADSVLQICGHEESMGLKTLYHYCEIARELTMKEEWKVGRVIARPYVGKRKGEFKRTSNRHDYAVKPYGRTVLDELKAAGFAVISVGKINDIFDGEGITEKWKSTSSVHGMEQTITLADQDFTGLCFVNLVDFDALWGHRRNVKGYAEELEKFDEKLGILLQKLRKDDLLILTADHGNDPTFHGTDHTREKVMFLAYSKSMKNSKVLPESTTFAQIGATVAENFGIKMPEGTIGESVWKDLQ